MFAALGPVVAIASLVDARIQGRKKARREKARFDAELAITRQEITEAHDAERVARDETAPSGSLIVERKALDLARWSSGPESIAISLGRGTTSSTVSMEGVRPSRSAEEAETAIAELARSASRLQNAPIVVDPRLGIGFCGPRVSALSAARGVLVQLAMALSPRDYWWAASGPVASEIEWLAALPHARSNSPSAGPSTAGPSTAEPTTIGPTTIGFGAIGSDEPFVSIVVAARASELPVGCRIVLTVDAGSSAIVSHPDPRLRAPIEPELVSLEQAISWADSARAIAMRDGLVADDRSIPDSVPLAPLLGSGGRGLACAPVVGATGPVVIDLAAHGPHAIVGGSTGSGKSEFLSSWVLAMAAAHSPAEVTFLLVDFKGGSAFTPIAALPHVVGVLTDLDEATCERALSSLRAELRHRERALADAGHRSVESSDLPRLVVVVDELAAMMNDFPELHALFTDIAARGRSLGVHLILCTQRPAAVARDGVLANADLRISLRVNNRADSVAVVGTDAAASLSASETGRAVLCIDGTAELVQVALASSTDAAAVVARWPGPWRPRRPWCDPLPEVLPMASLPLGAFGLVDEPGEQRQEPARFEPVELGHVLVLGAARSGKSTALAAIAEASGSAVGVPPDVEGAWDAVVAAHTMGAGLLVLDDLDSLVPRFGEEHRAAFLDSLERLLRDGPDRGLRLAVASQRIVGEVQRLAALFPTRLLLPQAAKHEYVMAGGEPSRYRPGRKPGRGEWFGREIQVAIGAAPVVVADRPPPRLLGPRRLPESRRALVVVSPRPAAVASRLRESFSVVEIAGNPADPRELVVSEGDRSLAIVGDPDEWQSRWGAIGALRQRADVVFEGCSLPEYRALTRSRELPPPLAPGSHGCWLLAEDATVSRALLPR